MKKRIITLIALIIIIVLSFVGGLHVGTTENKSTKPTSYHNECPMCHSCVKLMVHQYKFRSDYSIECLNSDCGMSTGYYKDKEELVEKWNAMFKALNERKEDGE